MAEPSTNRLVNSHRRVVGQFCWSSNLELFFFSRDHLLNRRFCNVAQINPVGFVCRLHNSEQLRTHDAIQWQNSAEQGECLIAKRGPEVAGGVRETPRSKTWQTGKLGLVQKKHSLGNTQPRAALEPGGLWPIFFVDASPCLR